MNRIAALNRSTLYKNIREYFTSRNYLEVETPSLSPTLIPEATIDNFETSFISDFVPSRQLYLIPSPEIHMKQLIAEGSGSIFEICKCFRNCEQIGSHHNPEFTMLEYYTVDFDEEDSIKLTEDFIKKTAIEGTPDSVLKDFEILTMRDAILKYTGLDLDKLQSRKSLFEAALSLNLHIPSIESWDDTFNRIFLTFVEPNLPKDHPVLIKDYPKQIECLAKAEGFYRKRWELYINGIEIANCYFEENDVEKVQDYYLTENAKLISIRNENGRVIPDTDPDYATIFKTFPKCSGVAIGLDRLLMVEMGAKSIDDILLFPFTKF